MFKMFAKEYNIFPRSWSFPAEYVHLHRVSKKNIHSYYWL